MAAYILLDDKTISYPKKLESLSFFAIEMPNFNRYHKDLGYLMPMTQSSLDHIAYLETGNPDVYSKQTNYDPLLILSADGYLWSFTIMWKFSALTEIRHCLPTNRGIVSARSDCSETAPQIEALQQTKPKGLSMEEWISRNCCVVEGAMVTQKVSTIVGQLKRKKITGGLPPMKIYKGVTNEKRS